VSADDLLAAASEGIAEITQGAPEGSGALAVSALRERVWGRPLGEGTSSRPLGDGTLTAGVGLAAYGLGFAQPGEQVRVFRAGPWIRASTHAGHILTR
jgi:hypothetical protein